MQPQRHTIGKQRLVGIALAGLCAAFTLGVAADPAAAAVNAHVRDGTLQIRGDAADDSILVSTDPNAPNRVLVDVGADGTTEFTFDLDSFSAIAIAAGGGNDHVTIAQSVGLQTKQTTINGGPGDDVLTGGSGDDVINGDGGNDVMVGGRGSDVINGGGGNDDVVWNPGDGSDVVEGQGGSDTLTFNGSNASEHFDLSANGSRVRLFRDVGDVTMDVNGIEHLALATLGGADTVTVNDLTGTDLNTAAIDLGASVGGGDGAPDTVIANGTNGPDNVRITQADSQVLVAGLAVRLSIANSESANDTLQVNTLAGTDHVTIGSGVSDLIKPLVDLGTDQ